MGSYTSVMNDTEADMFIEYAPNSEALSLFGIILSAIGFFPVAPVVNAVVTVTSIAITAAGMKENVSSELKKKGLSKIPPGGKYISERLSLSLVHQANIMLVQQLDDKRMSIKRGSMTVWSGATDNSTKRYNVSECSFDEEQELAANNEEEDHPQNEEEEHPDNEQGNEEQTNNEEGEEDHPQNEEEEHPDDEQGREEQINNGEGEE